MSLQFLMILLPWLFRAWRLRGGSSSRLYMRSLKLLTKKYWNAMFTYCFFRIRDPDTDWIRIQSGQWIRIRIRNPDPGGQK